MPEKRRNSRFLVWFLTVICAVLAALDLGLALKVRGLTSRIESLTRIVAMQDKSSLVEGASFPLVTLFGPSGKAVPLIVKEQHTGALLLISSQACDACDAVRLYWQRAAETARGSHLRVLELVLDANPEDLPRTSTPWPSAAPGDDQWNLVSRIPGIPAAIFVEDSGTVWRSFYGTDHAGLPDAVEQFLVR